jgi:hypothetical protein
MQQLTGATFVIFHPNNGGLNGCVAIAPQNR